ncbi:MAG: GNAT family N-acetyltransferase [Candidatus Melainabacteria bacterium]|nr:GNAT family N-acetyltransferase [Candidatus Melainabacteria bacterium]
MLFRRASGADFDGIVKLQDQNLASKISDKQKKDGFLSAAFSAQQFESMDNDGCVVIGIDEDQSVKAFLCSSTPMFNLPFPLPAAMIERFSNIELSGKKLSNQQVLITGPVCIDQSLRGQGVLAKLYEALYKELFGQYDAAVVFVSKENPRSIKAHEKLGMTIVDEFVFNAKDYVIMALALAK